MRFGRIPIAEADGAISVHTLRFGDVTLRKGSVVTTETRLRLADHGIGTLVAARLEPGDVAEDAAAARLAEAVAGDGTRQDEAFTGRANLFAATDGLLAIDAARVDAINAVDESLTLATLANWKPVVRDEMVATIKIIPFAVPGAALAAAVAAAASGPIVRVLPWRVARVGVASTLLPGLKPATVEKTLRVLEDRLAPTGAAIVDERRCDHETDALASQLRTLVAGPAEFVVVFGASAIADRRDVIPAAIEAAGGSIEHFGMPVDPGNLLLVGRLAGKPVIGAPGCARSPKENGFDWMLHRLLAGLPVTRSDITRLGVGGLLMEIVSRPQPRAGGEPDPE